MRRLMLTTILLILLGSLALPSTKISANDDIFYTTQPDSLAVFLNNVAYAQDSLQLPADTNVQIILPNELYRDTLLVYENEARVQTYRLNHTNGQAILRWTTGSDTDLRQVRLEYLMAGIAWQPKYDMWILDKENVQFDFFAEIQNSSLNLEDVEVRLIAGRVDTAQQLNTVTTVTTNQYIAGYVGNEVSIGDGGQPSLTGSADIQHIYEAGTLTAEPGDFIYTALLQEHMTARRIFLWNAHSDQEVTLIYKVKNESALPLAQGTVRSYENGLFLGSDFIEVTPIGSEGSVTVGGLQNIRVNRDETRTGVEGNYDRDTLHKVQLTATNFSDEPIELDIVDSYSADAILFEFAQEPERQAGNLLRWTISLEPGASVTLNYEYRD